MGAAISAVSRARIARRAPRPCGARAEPAYSSGMAEPAGEAGEGIGAGECPRLGRGGWLVVLAQLALLVHAAWRVGPTYDEHYYVASGYAYWRTGDFALNREHPPLLKLLAGAPLALFRDVDFPAQWKDLPA